MVLDSEKKARLRELANGVATSEGLRLYDLEVAGGAGRVLRVLIDRPEGGVTVDDCANVSRALSLLLDVEDLVPGGAFDLEISSPGLERKLVEPWHFDAALTKAVRVQVSQPVKWNSSSDEMGAALKTLVGVLERTHEIGIELTDGAKWCSIPWSEIVRAQVVFRPDAKGKKR